MIEFSALPATPLLPGQVGTVLENPAEGAETGALPPEFAALLAATTPPPAALPALPGATPVPASGPAGGKPGGKADGKTLPDAAPSEEPISDTAEPGALPLPATLTALMPFLAAQPEKPAEPGSKPPAPALPVTSLPAPVATAPATTTQVAPAPELPPVALQPRLILPGREVALPMDLPAQVAPQQTPSATGARKPAAAPTPVLPRLFLHAEPATDLPAVAKTVRAESAAPLAAEAVLPVQTLVAAADPAAPAPVMSSTPASAPATAPAPHDFAALVDRLATARDHAMEAQAPQALHASVRHAEFGAVTLRFETGADGLAVALSSPDPDFARAVQAAAPSSQTAGGQTSSGQTSTGGEGNAPSPRQDQHAGQSPAERQPQQRTAPRGSQTSPPAPEGGQPRPRGGIFA